MALIKSKELHGVYENHQTPITFSTLQFLTPSLTSLPLGMCKHMSHELIKTVIALPTPHHCTHVTALFPVRLSMLRQIGTLREFLVTNRTLKWLLVSVSALMNGA